MKEKIKKIFDNFTIGEIEQISKKCKGGKITFRKFKEIMYSVADKYAVKEEVAFEVVKYCCIKDR